MSAILPILFVAMILWMSVGTAIFFCEVLAPNLKCTTRRMIFYILMAGPVVWVFGLVGLGAVYLIGTCETLWSRISKREWWRRFGAWLDAA